MALLRKQIENTDTVKKESICVFCFNVLNIGEFTVVDETIRGILDILFQTPITRDTNFSSMCNDCSARLFAAFDFKTKCVETEDCIFPYVSPDKKVDLKEVYLNENAKEQLKFSEDNQICRLCMQVALPSQFVLVKDVNVDEFSLYIPEVNFISTKDPIVCRVCLESLHTHTEFLKNCLATKRRPKKKCIKTKPNVKHEEIVIKYEKVESKTAAESTHTPATVTVKEEAKPSKSQTYSCGGCKYCPIVEKEPEPEKKKKTKVYKCEYCDYTTVRLNWHMWRNHAYKCDMCSYTTGVKRKLNEHILMHSEKFKCNACDFETHSKNILSRHAKKHKMADTVATTTYQCNYPECSFNTLYEIRLQKHLVTHQPKVWKCDTCRFQTRYKHHLRAHAKRHNMDADGRTYRCAVAGCDFQSGYKYSVERHHLLVHEKKKRKCGLCDFETLCTKDLNQHVKTHKLPLELPTYKCDYSDCEFKTVYKMLMDSHLSSHKKRGRLEQSCVSKDGKGSKKYKLKSGQSYTSE